MPIGFRAQDDMFANFKKVRKSLNDVIIDIK
jgi:nitroreductase/dihydropteridine reductase